MTVILPSEWVFSNLSNWVLFVEVAVVFFNKKDDEYVKFVSPVNALAPVDVTILSLEPFANVGPAPVNSLPSPINLVAVIIPVDLILPSL